MTAPLRRVALTGGIATGKSYCLDQFAKAGAATIDADTLARQAVEPGTAGFEAVRARFGAAVVAPDGGLDRAALGRIVFADAASRRALESIIHPAVYGAIGRWFESVAGGGRHRVAMAAIPLLYETGHEGDFDKVVVTICRPRQQIVRLMSRGNISAEEAGRRIEAQMPAKEKARRGDYVIDTSGTFEDTDRQVADVWRQL